MDDFRKANVDFLTAYDLNAWCVGYNHKTRRELMQMANRIARKRLRAELRKEEGINGGELKSI